MSVGDIGALLEEHHAAAYGWALHCCAGNAEDAADILQVSYNKVLDGKATFQGRSSFKTWLFGVIKNTARAERRKWIIRNVLMLKFDQFQHAQRHDNNPASAFHEKERQKILGRILKSLPERQGQVLHLIFYQSLTLQEAADVMQISVGSARQHYDRAKQKLRDKKELLEGLL